MKKWWQFWKKDEPVNPVIRIEVLPDYKARIVTTWPEANGDEASLQTARLLATAIFLLTTGELTDGLYHSVIKGGAKQNSEKIAEMVTSYIDQAFEKMGQNNNFNGVFVPQPGQVFGMNDD